ncbi:crossover junction endodeoxyribonuclease RuvC [Bartonella vinsonii]|uniref:crossover junction endodeoxyribonuclease RuvC n=1 Tax=Bartonella vinsonii TaxID=33047 RepID=UPI003CCF7F9D
MGWAICGVDGHIFSGTANFQTSRFESKGRRYFLFQKWLTEMKMTAGQIDAVYFEEVRRHIGTDAAHVYGGFLGHLTAWCEHHEIPYEGIPVGTIKKAATGRGNASKEEMIQAMRAKGHNPKDDNEADALAILHLVKGKEGIHVY